MHSRQHYICLVNKLIMEGTCTCSLTLIEPLLRGYLSYKATFSFSQGRPLKTGLILLSVDTLDQLTIGVYLLLLLVTLSTIGFILSF
jgi:hypothetical protein